MSDFIRLDSLVCQNGQLRYTFSSSLNIFKKKDFFIEYSKPIEKPVESINTIPFAGIMMPIAWATGAELIVPSLDRSYIGSLEVASAYWKKCYRKWPFSPRLITKAVENETPQKGLPESCGMLFSGGLDSLATYAHHRDKKPELFTAIGADFFISKSNFVTLCKEKLFNEFAAQEKVRLTYITTDMSDILDYKRLERYAENWYGAVQHGLMLTSLVAPVSHHYLKTLYIASCSHKLDYNFPCGSDPEAVRYLKWANTHVEDDLHEINRMEKVREYLKDHPSFHKYLRVCWAQFEQMNCSRCEKCLHTICEILINNEDPNHYNFKVTCETLAFLKHKLKNRYYLFFRGNERCLNFWRVIQQSIDLDKIEDRYGSKEFFAWFKNFKKLRKKQNPVLLFLWLRLLDIRDLLKKMVKFRKEKI